jgi:hypothetical protein
MQLVEIEHGIDLPVYLREQYASGLKLSQIGAALKVDTGTISRWMAHFGIATRRTSS